MHALMAFSAYHLSWLHNSNELRSLQAHHGGLALRDLQEVFKDLTQLNAEAALAGSVLMFLQSTDLYVQA